MDRSRLRRLPIEFRAVDSAEDTDEPQFVLVGYASVFDTEYRIGYGLKESIQKGAFAESIKRQGGVIPIFYEHNWSEPLGFANAEEDDHGVRVEATLFADDLPQARAVWRAAQAGALREWSIGFMPETISFDDEEGVEIVERGELIEASVVVRGANPETEMVEVRREHEDVIDLGEYVDRAWVRDLLRDEF